MQRGMEAVSALRRWGIVREPARFSEFLRFCGDLLGPFGSDTGGMIVEAFGRDADDRPVRARWSMFAPDGLGPYTPTFAALALARRFVEEGTLPVGAHACVAMLRLEDFEPEFKRHTFETRIDVTHSTSPFEAALGSDFARLSPSVQAAHRGGPVTRLSGHARVEGSQSPFAEILANLFGFPLAQDHVALRVTKRHMGDVEVWIRDFGGRRMRSRLRALGPGRVRESFGPFHFDMAVSASAEGLIMTVVGWKLGPLPLPKFLAPRSTATETPAGPGCYRFDVPIAAPILGRLTHYSGDLALEVVEDGAAPAARESA